MLNSVVFSFLLALFANADMSMNRVEAKMAAPTMVPASSIIKLYEAQQKKGKLSEDEDKVYSLTKIASQIFDIKEFATYGGGSTAEDKAKNVALGVVANSIQAAIESRDWNKAVSKSDLDMIEKQKDSIKESLGENSLTMAWMVSQGGKNEEAKAILNRSFEKSYEETMKTEHIYGKGSRNPIYYGESLSKILTPLSTEKENKDRAEKLQKMRTHISNLPDMQMMT